MKTKLSKAERLSRGLTKLARDHETVKLEFVRGDGWSVECDDWLGKHGFAVERYYQSALAAVEKALKDLTRKEKTNGKQIGTVG